MNEFGATLNRSQNTTDRGRIPPHNIAAEESLLGAMLLSAQAIADVVQVVHAEDFYKPAHRHIFEAITVLYNAGEAVDPVTVAEELRRANLLDAIGGPATLLTIEGKTPAITNAEYYAKIVDENSLLRRLIATAGEVAELGYAPLDDITKTLDFAESRMYEIAQRRVTDSMAELRELLDASVDRLAALYDRGSNITGVPTGLTDLDKLLSGLQPAALYIVGARPAMGKTAFALTTALNAAKTSDAPVLFFSLEMSHLEITQRLLCTTARVDASKVRTGDLKEGDWNKVNRAVGELAELPLWIDDNPNLTIMEIRAKARRLKSRVGKLGLVVIDYLQLMSGRSTAENRQVEVSEISRGLKILARELECPVMALSQLSRNLEQRQDKRPILADLRESGSLEQDADVVMFLYRDEVYNPTPESAGEAEIIVSKHRNGPIGTCHAVFLGHINKFESATRRDDVPSF